MGCVAALVQTAARLDDTVAAIERDGGEALALTADVSEAAHVEEAVTRTVER